MPPSEEEGFVWSSLGRGRGALCTLSSDVRFNLAVEVVPGSRTLHQYRWQLLGEDVRTHSVTPLGQRVELITMRYFLKIFNYRLS